MRVWFIKNRHFLNKVMAVTLVFSFFWFDASIIYAQNLDFNTSEEIKDLNKEISEQNEKIESLEDQAGQYAEVIRQKQSEALTLENELSIISNRIKKTELDIERTEKEIELTNLKIEEAKLQIQEKESQVNFQKVQIAALIREIHREDQRGNLEIFLLNDNLSKYFSYVNRLEEVQQNMQMVLNDVKEAKRDLDINKHTLEVEKASLQDQVLAAEIQQQKLGEERDLNDSLIEETEASEAQFQQRLSQIRFQQRLANEEINRLAAEIKEKLRQAQLRKPGLQLNPNQLIWPIPNQGITTRFHDPGYPFRHIVGEHSGLDLRTLIGGFPSMGLPIRAPADGVVIKTIRNGRFTGNAVFLSHGDIMTVYLHLSALHVQIDDVVEIGETIGLTGGAPGHPGAGLSSGPHLHFEVRQNGVPVNPCNYLNPAC